MCCALRVLILFTPGCWVVPRSIEDPIATNQSNVDGFLNMLWLGTLVLKSLYMQLVVLPW